ncbi:patatin-like phospholipase protein [Ceratobasidium sp. AG-Ba]|nr:patatin-like phospholipase protein [Ceratobasidium sp. AG-Ba]QRW04233.1 patatin-like phospholipase protein [Ceratobasidium sp. AG-Ba]
MPTSAGSAWDVVDGHRARTTSQGAKKDFNLLEHVSLEELREQQKLLDRFKRKKRQTETTQDGGPGSLSVVFPSVPIRRLKNLPSDPALSRNITIRSDAATVGDADDIGLLFEPSAHPAQRKHARSEAQPKHPTRRPARAQTEATRPDSGTVLLNVNMIGRMSLADYPERSPTSGAYQFPVIPTPLSQVPQLPLESLPSGYALNSAAHLRTGEIQSRPLRLLSLDGGGVRGISSLHILKAIMDRIAPGARPCDYFDLIAGTSTGGLIAIMLGRLRMTVDDCIGQYHKLAKKIFKRSRAAKFGSIVSGENRFDPANLEEAIKGVVETASPKNTKMADHHPRCARVFVVAVKKNNVNNETARRIRTYSTHNYQADTCEIWQAGRATSAAPSYFPPIELPDERGRTAQYIDGGLGYNNPAKELLYEARNVFGPNAPIGCFISIGTGYDKNVAVGRILRAFPAYAAFKAIALGSEKAHQEMEEFFLRETGTYYRFNAGVRLIDANGNGDFVQAVGLEDWHKMGEIEDLTRAYLKEKETSDQLDRCIRKLSSKATNGSRKQTGRDLHEQ